MSIIKQVLETDSKYRYSGVVGDLFTLDEIKVVKEIKQSFSEPMLVHKSKYDNFSDLQKVLKFNTNEDFALKFFEKFPELKGVFNNNTFVAGGLVQELLANNYSETQDVDIFIYGTENPTEVVDSLFDNIISNLINIKVEKRIQNDTKNKRKILELDEYRESEKKDLELHFKRSKNCITLNNKYQVILRLYKTKSEVLHGFDIGSSAVGFDGEKVYFTTLSKFAYEYSCNIVDTTRRSTTYERRLVKYFDRGFSIVLPNFNIKMLDDRIYRKYDIPNICEMNQFCFSYLSVDENMILINLFHFENRHTETSDYDAGNDNEYATFFLNVNHLLNGDNNSIISFSDNHKNIIYDPKVFTRHKIQYFYREYADKLNSNRFPRHTCSKYIRLAPVNELVMMDRKQLKNICETQSQIVMRLAESYENANKNIQWKTQDPMSQLTGSFNPIIENPEEWYGKLYYISD